MASVCSFDIVSKVEPQEIDNAVNQAKQEIGLRYDFKGSKSSFEFKRTEMIIVLLAEDQMKLHSMQEILRAKIVKRSIPIKALSFEKEETVFGDNLRQNVTVQAGISKENARIIVKDIKETKTKVQAAIQDDQIRVTGKKIDDLQEVMAVLKEKDYDFSLQYVNFRR